jgi:hypothetical protein
MTRRTEPAGQDRISHEAGLDSAVAADERFDAREDGWTKVILHSLTGKRRPHRERRNG